MWSQYLKNILQTSKLQNGQYNFIANVWDPFNKRVLCDQVDLQFLPRKKGVIIQTDKDIYKPGDLIRFRLFGLDGESRPANIDDKVQVFFIDPQGVVLAAIANVTFSRGLYKNEFQLSSFVITGLWKIRVQVGEKVRLIQSQVQFTD